MKKGKNAQILTFHAVPNYGAVLQAYALQRKLTEYFDDVSILDYRPQKLIDEYALINTYSYKSVIMSIYSAPQFIAKKHNFNKFIDKNIKLTKHNGNVHTYDADYYFLGSDQIWNPDITDGFDTMYFAGFDKAEHSKAVSYAASLGKISFSENEKEQFNELLKNIDNISVRESDAGLFVSENFGRKADVVLDPTLLLTGDDWSKMTSKQKKGKYILLYSLNGYKETSVLAEKVARYFGIQLIELSGKRKPLINTKHKSIYTAGPSEFLSLIHGAEYVVTDSFHGTVFSLLFHKSFITVPHKTRGGRIVNILSKVGLSERISATFNKDIIKKDIDWKNVDEALFEERKKSESFIIDAIGGIFND